MKVTKGIFGAMLVGLLFIGCSKDDDETPSIDETTTFRITLTNTINLLATHIFNTPDGASQPGPIADEGGSYTVSFKAVPGTKMSFVTMLANSNDWFFAPGENGVDLFDADGNAVTGDITTNVRLYDAGTEEEDPATIATEPNGGTEGDPDDDTSVRTQQQDVANYLSATLDYDNGTFTLKITKAQDGIITPGIVVLHAQNNPLFTNGEADRGQGLKLLAEAGNPGELNDWVNETGTDGAPLRLSAALTPFAPGVVYAFDSEKDPLFTQGEASKSDNGLEELAEDGNNDVIFNYLSELDLPVAKQNEDGILGIGGKYTFDLEVPKGYKLGLATMFIQSNDWFVGFNNNGAALFDEAGNPKFGTDESVQLYLYDAGTEVDEAIGFGDNQAPRQGGANTGADDDNTTVRRVGEIDNVQFGRGMLESAPGVVSQQDARGGYNLVQLNIEEL
ncbi:MAG: spondin domain-containing protein [Chitinophagales bacterium]|nr:spondin domain-containing protein [Chitinophagales bacterium]